METEAPVYERFPLELLNLLLSLVPWQLPFLWRTSKWWQGVVEWYEASTGLNGRGITPQGAVSSLTVLAWCKKNLVPHPNLLKHAVCSGEKEVVEELLKTEPTISLGVLSSGVKGDRPKLLEFLLEEYRKRYPCVVVNLEELAESAARFSALNSLKWLLSQSFTFDFSKLFASALAGTDPRVLEFLKEKYGSIPFPRYPGLADHAEIATLNGSLTSLQWLEKEGYHFSVQTLLFLAAEYAEEEVFDWLLPRGVLNLEVLQKALKGGSEGIIKQVLSKVKPDRELLVKVLGRNSSLQLFLESYPSLLEDVLWLSVDLNQLSAFDLCIRLGAKPTPSLLFLAASLDRVIISGRLLALGVSLEGYPGVEHLKKLRSWFGDPSFSLIKGEDS